MLNHSGFLNAFRRAPMTTKVAILSRIVAQGDQPGIAVSKLLDLVSAMAPFLDIDERIDAVVQVRDVIAALAPRRCESEAPTLH